MGFEITSRTRCSLEATEVLDQKVVERGGLVLTFPQGLAIKLGVIPCFMPTLLAKNLNRIALSAILRAGQYAKAVS